MDKFLSVTGFFISWNLCKPAPGCRLHSPAHKKSCGINPQQKSIPKKQSVFRYCQGTHALHAWFSALLPRKMQNPGTANKRSSNRSAPLLSLPLAHSSAGKNQHDSTSYLYSAFYYYKKFSNRQVLFCLMALSGCIILLRQKNLPSRQPFFQCRI